MNKDLVSMINNQDLRVVSVNNEQSTFLCSDGNDYPLEICVTTEELQKHLDKAKQIMKEILSQDGEVDEP